jgi:hypothetical protein
MVLYFSFHCRDSHRETEDEERETEIYASRQIPRKDVLRNDPHFTRLVPDYNDMDANLKKGADQKKKC